MDPTVTLLLALVVVVVGASAVFALRNRLAFRLAMRNVRRGRWRTVLVVLGLLVGTTIVSGSLVIGDTVNQANVHFTYQALGFTDEAVYNHSLTGGYLKFPYSTFVAINQSVHGDPEIAGIAPEIVATGQLLDQATGVPQTGLNLVGGNPNQTGQLGPFHTLSGTALPGPGPGQVFLDSIAANDVNASVNHPVLIYGATGASAVVAAIVQDDLRGGFLGGGNIFVDLPLAQAVENASGQVNFLAVTNAGSQASGVGLSSSVSATLNATLVKVGNPYGLAVHQLLADNLAAAQTAGSSLSTLFLVLGLFSIVAGAMLIVGIFVMLAEERKGEMGMLRAIGLTRRHLVLTYYFEGLVYSAGSALAGTFLGVALGYLLAYTYSVEVGAGSRSGQAILQSFTFTTQTLVIGYVVGFLLTLGTVLLASSRVSRLNIVRAIRSIPEPPPALRLYTRLAYLGILLVGVGLAVYFLTYQGATDISYPLLGGALVIVGAALLASRFVANRIAFSAAGVALLVWGGSTFLQNRLLGTAHSGTVFVAFVEGVILVVGAVLLYVFNADSVVRGLAWLAARFKQSAPVTRIGLSYPSRRGFRTAINLMIFALVLFTVVAVASFGASLQQNLNQTVQAQSGGYTFFATSTNPIPNLPGIVQNNSTLRPLFSHVVPMNTGGVGVVVPGATTPYADELFAAPVGVPANQNFYTSNTYNFSSTLNGMTAAQVWSRLETNLTVAVVDGSYSSAGINFGSAPHPSVNVGDFVTATSHVTGGTLRLKVIGILAEMFVSGVWTNPQSAASIGIDQPFVYYLTVNPGVNPTYAAQQAKIALYPYGFFTYDFAQILNTSIQNTEAIVGLLEVFVALGLAVGIAAMGIVALRAVVERRAEIGMLRAEGFTQGMVFRVFLLEYSYVALLGIGIGATLGILLDFELAAGNGGLVTFAVPWATVAIIVGVAYALVVAAIAAPSIRAARLPPAEAVRYSE